MFVYMIRREVLLEYINTSTEMVQKLLQVLIGNLRVKLDDSRLLELMGFNLVNMNFYPPYPNPDLTIGVGSLSDAGMLTVLLQWHWWIIREKRTHSANHGRRVKSVSPKIHRTTAHNKNWRFPELVPCDGVARYKEVIYGEYLKNYFEKSLDGKKSLDFASI
ncbi:putative isopenicillin N synthase [Helianthus annuus]|uniref:Isopenicillin N synthase n=1 Tax=Helianthus annuus TaxID=4232 RepID=A0A251UKG2_HELAN|nr:putative isopenicillin N synthase [Helianthus annuus]KAJ0583086.1 putative isopenicillin N synthase [Helianthus annuus]KAJ0745836.1 putative isopenicillin N synthase [Helianthus annuus]KAJ0917220.1 putative isopenicillin N synthase [Helianthus annuus]